MKLRNSTLVAVPELAASLSRRTDRSDTVTQGIPSHCFWWEVANLKYFDCFILAFQILLIIKLKQISTLSSAFNVIQHRNRHFSPTRPCWPRVNAHWTRFHFLSICHLNLASFLSLAVPTKGLGPKTLTLFLPPQMLYYFLSVSSIISFYFTFTLSIKADCWSSCHPCCELQSKTWNVPSVV